MNDETIERLARDAGFQPDEQTQKLLEQDIIAYGSCMTRTTINPDGTATVERIIPPQALK